MIPAPRRIPLQPNDPNLPVFGGMKGWRLALLACDTPTAMKSARTAIFMMTMMVFTRADSRMPMTSSAVTARHTITAGRLKIAVTEVPSASIASVPGAPARRAGQDENPGPDDGANAEGDERDRSQLAPEGAGVGFGQQRSQILPDEERHRSSAIWMRNCIQ